MEFKFEPTALVVPAFFIFLGLEYFLAYKRKLTHFFNYESSLTNISVGIAERLLNLFITGSFYSLYNYVYEHYGWLRIPNTWWVWIILLLATDFVWYWYHRLGHEVNLFWGAHIVHHQSEEYNYTVSARITTLQAIVRNIFWIVLPLMGFHPTMVITILVVHGTYSFFTHTQIIGKLGWAEYIFITPSHHGVHHASNEKYLDKNYGDIFVFWDKLFGTFQPEEEKPRYGLTHPLKSKSFLWQHFHYYLELLEACRRSGSMWKSLKIIFGQPSQLDPNIRPFLERRLLPKKGSYKASLRFKVYLNVQIVFSLGMLVAFTMVNAELGYIEKSFTVFFILLTLINCGALLEQQRWVYQLEIVRLLTLAAYVSFAFESIWLFSLGITTVLIMSMLQSVKSTYFRFVYQQENLAT
ncbi:MAG: sterol desaturase family protein [Bacteroidota bacterium]|jgi:alkylglycerol monooxygenase|nr:sterol desaturase family protein [Cytophagales bacterium]MCE2955599.1 sterol desaturase family protein [Flammeovirgaceae bacterium]MCZ8071981.1 sterol desaturase family protein [Cytophagales bacterium]